MIHWRAKEGDTEDLFLPGRLSTDRTEDSPIIEILNQTISADRSENRDLVLIALGSTLCLRSESAGKNTSHLTSPNPLYPFGTN